MQHNAINRVHLDENFAFVECHADEVEEETRRRKAPRCGVQAMQEMKNGWHRKAEGRAQETPSRFLQLVFPELQRLNKSELLQRAHREGASLQEVDDAFDEEDQRQALMKLLMSRREEKDEASTCSDLSDSERESMPKLEVKHVLYDLGSYAPDDLIIGAFDRDGDWNLDSNELGSKLGGSDEVFQVLRKEPRYVMCFQDFNADHSGKDDDATSQPHTPTTTASTVTDAPTLAQECAFEEMLMITCAPAESATVNGLYEFRQSLFEGKPQWQKLNDPDRRLVFVPKFNTWNVIDTAFKNICERGSLMVSAGKAASHPTMVQSWQLAVDGSFVTIPEVRVAKVGQTLKSEISLQLGGPLEVLDHELDLREVPLQTMRSDSDAKYAKVPLRRASGLAIERQSYAATSRYQYGEDVHLDEFCSKGLERVSGEALSKENCTAISQCRASDDVRPSELSSKVADILGNGPMLLKTISAMAMKKQTCRVVQKAIVEACNSDKDLLAEALKDDVQALCESPNGNHVMTAAIENWSPDTCEFIISAVQDRCTAMAMHKFSCRVVNRLIEYCSLEQVKGIVQGIMQNVYKLARHKFGKHTIEVVLQRIPHLRSDVLAYLIGDFLDLCCHRDGSIIVERLLTFCDRQDQSKIINTMVRRGDSLIKLASEKYGSHVLAALAKHPESSQIRCILEQHVGDLREMKEAQKVLEAFEMQRPLKLEI
jgi:hypothetical protein